MRVVALRRIYYLALDLPHFGFFLFEFNIGDCNILIFFTLHLQKFYYKYRLPNNFFRLLLLDQFLSFYTYHTF